MGGHKLAIPVQAFWKKNLLCFFVGEIDNEILADPGSIDAHQEAAILPVAGCSSFIPGESCTEGAACRKQSRSDTSFASEGDAVDYNVAHKVVIFVQLIDWDLPIGRARRLCPDEISKV